MHLSDQQDKHKKERESRSCLIAIAGIFFTLSQRCVLSGREFHNFFLSTPADAGVFPVFDVLFFTKNHIDYSLSG
jgi:hypothetical protein